MSDHGATTTPAPALLEVRGLTKAFPGTLALDHVDLTLRAGTVTGLAGHNGSGKSTLVKILASVYKADEGHISHPAAADGSPARIHFIHQDLGLAENLTTIENLGLCLDGGWRRSLTSPRASRERADAERLLGKLGVTLDVSARLTDLSPAQRTMVAIARATAHWDTPTQVLVLDEPTAALQDREAEVVLDVTRRLADAGAAVLFISHRLEEVTRLADDVIVLRDGRVAAHASRGAFDAHALAELIAGEALTQDSAPSSVQPVDRPDRLTVAGLTSATLNGVDLSVRAGEIVGISGVIGSGVETVLPSIFGSIAGVQGGVHVDGTPVPRASIRAAIAAGIGFVPRDRHAHGAVMTLSGQENLMLPRTGDYRTWRGSLDDARERGEARSWFRRAGVRPGRPERTFSQFSGGNQQKIVLSRWMRTAPDVLLLEEPTQGVDVGAQHAIYELVRGAAASGTAVLVASSDTAELVALCDRVVVMSGGRIVTELSGAALNESALVRQTLAPVASENNYGEEEPMQEEIRS